MHDQDELCLEPGLYICGGNGIVSDEWRVHDYAEMFDLEIGLVQGLKGTAVVKIMIKGHSKMQICDGSDKCGMFSGRWEQAELVIVDRDINGQNGGDFYSIGR